MKKIITLICITLIAGSAAAQKTNFDSLRRALSAAATDSVRNRVLDKLASAYGDYKPDSGIYYSSQLMTSGRQKHDQSIIINAMANYAYAFYNKGNYADALKMGLQVIKAIENGKDLNYLANVYNMMGNIYKGQENYLKAIHYYKLTQKTALKCGDLRDVLFSYMNLGYVMEEINQLDSGIYYANKAILYTKTTHYDYGIDYDYNTIGNVCFKRENYQQAHHYYVKSYELARSISDKKVEAVACISLSKYYTKLSKPDSALYFAKQALAIARKSSFGKSAYEAATLLSSIYGSQNHVDSAFKYLKLSSVTKDSIYNATKFQEIENLTTDEFLRQTEILAAETAYRNRLRTYGLAFTLLVFLVILFLLWRNNHNKQKAYLLLQEQKAETERQKVNVESTLQELKVTQQQLIQSEKMASLGELTAGIAHEIQNPLNFVNNFAEVNIELLDEMETELKSGDKKEALAIASDVKQNLEKIRHHGQRADGIVKGMLQHSRASSNTKEPTDVNKLADEYLRLAYHGLRAKDRNFNAELETNFDPKLPPVNLVPQDIGRVLLNLFTNAFYATEQRKKLAAGNYSPVVKVSTAKIGDNLEIKVRDNGNGIPEDIRDKIMQPFFTTKPTGEGTGLGLSMSYDIVVKGHGGSIQIESNENEYTEFIILIPA